MQIFILVFLLFFSFGKGEAMIQDIHHLGETEALFQDVSDEALVVFDVDMVLTHPKNPAFQMSNMLKHRPIARSIIKSLSEEERDLFINLMVATGDLMLIDEESPKVIKELQRRKVKTMALTGALAGSLASIENMVKWRFDSLQSFGIDFSSSFPEKREILLDHFPMRYKSFPQFYRGILFTNGSVGEADKGKVLVSFLQNVGWVPQKVFFFDDRKENLIFVEKALEQYDPKIQFKGFHYTGGLHYPSEELSVEAFEKAWTDLLKVTEALVGELEP